MTKIAFKTLLKNTLAQPAGDRFEYLHHQIKNNLPKHWMIRGILLLCSIVFIGIGIILLFLPGPGLLFIVLGLLPLIGMSQRGAQHIDKIEKKLSGSLKRLLSIVRKK